MKISTTPVNVLHIQIHISTVSIQIIKIHTTKSHIYIYNMCKACNVFFSIVNNHAQSPLHDALGASMNLIIIIHPL